MKLVKFLFILLLPAAVFADFTIKDMRGEDVVIKEPLNSVLTIDDGFVEGVMTHFGVIDKVKAIGSWSMKRDYKYEFEKKDGSKYMLRGWNTMKYLHPWLDNLPCVNSAQGNIINFEEIAKINPDLIILRIGDCTLRGSNKENVDKTVKTIENLGLNLAVIYSPSYYSNMGLESMKDEMAVLGEIFKKKQKALNLYEYLNNYEKFIQEKTKDIQENQKNSILYIGLNPNIRKKGGAGGVHGINTPESHIIEKIVNAKNAFSSEGSNVILSYEQIYALNPDVLILPTSNGYHPASEVYDSSYYEILNELNAVKSKKIYAMPWSPMNCARRLEYPLDMLIIAKAAYPERFKDIKIHEEALKLYKFLYNVDDEKAKALRTEQILDWTLDEDF